MNHECLCPSCEFLIPHDRDFCDRCAGLCRMSQSRHNGEEYDYEEQDPEDEEPFEDDEAPEEETEEPAPPPTPAQVVDEIIAQMQRPRFTLRTGDWQNQGVFQTNTTGDWVIANPTNDTPETVLFHPLAEEDPF